MISPSILLNKNYLKPMLLPDLNFSIEESSQSQKNISTICIKYSIKNILKLILNLLIKTRRINKYTNQIIPHTHTHTLYFVHLHFIFTKNRDLPFNYKNIAFIDSFKINRVGLVLSYIDIKITQSDCINR